MTSPSTEHGQASFLLEVQSVLNNGYLPLAGMDHDAPVYFGRAGQSTAHHFTPVTADFRLSLKCSKPDDSFCLIITRQPEKSRKVGFCIRLEGQESGFHHDDRVFLPSGKVPKVVLKRKISFGKPIYVVEILISQWTQF